MRIRRNDAWTAGLISLENQSGPSILLRESIAKHRLRPPSFAPRPPPEGVEPDARLRALPVIRASGGRKDRDYSASRVRPSMSGRPEKCFGAIYLAGGARYPDSVRRPHRHGDGGAKDAGAGNSFGFRPGVRGQDPDPRRSRPVARRPDGGGCAAFRRTRFPPCDASGRHRASKAKPGEMEGARR